MTDRATAQPSEAVPSRPADQFRLPAALHGAAWMLLACACFSSMNGIVRHLSADLEPLVIVFFRCLFGMIAVLPWVLRSGVATLRSNRPGIHLVRALLAVVAMVSWFYGLSKMPLAEATALSFTTPLFASIAAVLLLGEVMRVRRWSATLIGFAGALIILRPGFVDLSDASYLVLGAAILMAVSQTIVKHLTKTDHPNGIVFWLAFLLTPLSAVPAWLVWQTPSLSQLLWLVALGMVATLGHQSMVRSYRVADVTAVTPLDFTRLPFAALIGYFAFAELPDVWTWIGAGVIVSSSVYIAHREARLRRRQNKAEKAVAGGTGTGP